MEPSSQMMKLERGMSMSVVEGEDGGRYVSKDEFYEHMLKIERRLSRLEIIFSINLIITIVTLLKTLLG